MDVSGLFIGPIRRVTGITQALYYNTSTREIVYSDISSSGSGGTSSISSFSLDITNNISSFGAGTSDVPLSTQGTILNNSGFSSSLTGNKITYTGSSTKYFNVIVNASVFSDLGSASIYSKFAIEIVKNTTAVSHGMITTDAGFYYQLSFSKVIQLATNDTISFNYTNPGVIGQPRMVKAQHPDMISSFTIPFTVNIREA